MEKFSFLTISGPLIQNGIIPIPVNDMLPAFPVAIKDPTGKLPHATQRRTSVLWEVKHTASLKCPQSDNLANSEGPHPSSEGPHPSSEGPHPSSEGPHPSSEGPSHCSLYRPWFSPYSYFACPSMESLLVYNSIKKSSSEDGMDMEAAGDQETSLPSASFSLLNQQPMDPTTQTAPEPKDRISPQDILKASRSLAQYATGYRCAACCRLYPNLYSLHRHVRHGRRQGYSCKVFYRKLKSFWERDRKVESAQSSGGGIPPGQKERGEREEREREGAL